MKRITPFLLYISVLLSCNEGIRVPSNLAPTVTALQPTDITRRTAMLRGIVTQHGGSVTQAYFSYGAMPLEVSSSSFTTRPLSLNDDTLSAYIDGLKANTTYYYNLNAGDGITSSASNNVTFTTARAAEVQTLPATEVTRVSATLHGEVFNIGVTDIRRALFRFGRSELLENTAEISSPNIRMDAYVDGLLHGSCYYYALEIAYDDTIAISDTAMFVTEKRTDASSIWVEHPGQLGQLLTDEDLICTDTLHLSGKLNGDDLRTIRRALGKDIDNNATNGHVAFLDMADSQIIGGGGTYDGMHFSSDNVVGIGLFADCNTLKQIALPQSTVVIEGQAFNGCTMLKELHIPSSVVELSPSTGCDSLKKITVSAANTVLASTDGVLFDKYQSTLIWFPQGVSGNYSVPQSVTRISASAFAGSKLTQLTISDNIETIETATFQNCRVLQSLTLGAGLLVMSDYVLSGSSLSELHLKCSDFLPKCNDKTFAGAEDLFNTCTLYVPKGSKNRYRQHQSWGRFQRIVEE